MRTSTLPLFRPALVLPLLLLLIWHAEIGSADEEGGGGEAQEKQLATAEDNYEFGVGATFAPTFAPTSNYTNTTNATETPSVASPPTTPPVASSFPPPENDVTPAPQAPNFPTPTIPTMRPTETFENVQSFVTHFYLVNAEDDTDIQELFDGDVLVLSNPPDAWNIRATAETNSSLQDVTAVTFFLDGAFTLRDTQAPYSLDDTDGDFAAYPNLSQETDSLTIKATPDIEGKEGVSKEITISIVQSYVTQFYLVNAEDDTDIQELYDGDVLVLSNPPEPWNIRAVAVTNSSTVDVSAVAFLLDGSLVTTDAEEPFSLEDTDGDFAAYPNLSQETDSLTIKATPDIEGKEGVSKEITISIVQSYVTQFYLVSADTNTDVQVLVNGTALVLSDPPESWNIRATAETNSTLVNVTEVLFFLDGAFVVQDGQAPYSLNDTGGDYASFPGLSNETDSLIIKATPYIEDREGISKEITISISSPVESAQEATNTPTMKEALLATGDAISAILSPYPTISPSTGATSGAPSIPIVDNTQQPPSSAPTQFPPQGENLPESTTAPSRAPNFVAPAGPSSTTNYVTSAPAKKPTVSPVEVSGVQEVPTPAPQFSPPTGTVEKAPSKAPQFQPPAGNAPPPSLRPTPRPQVPTVSPSRIIVSAQETPEPTSKVGIQAPSIRPFTKAPSASSKSSKSPTIKAPSSHVSKKESKSDKCDKFPGKYDKCDYLEAAENEEEVVETASATGSKSGKGKGGKGKGGKGKGGKGKGGKSSSGSSVQAAEESSSPVATGSGTGTNAGNAAVGAAEDSPSASPASQTASTPTSDVSTEDDPSSSLNSCVFCDEPGFSADPELSVDGLSCADWQIIASTTTNYEDCILLRATATAKCGCPFVTVSTGGDGDPVNAVEQRVACDPGCFTADDSVNGRGRSTLLPNSELTCGDVLSFPAVDGDETCRVLLETYGFWCGCPDASPPCSLCDNGLPPSRPNAKFSSSSDSCGTIANSLSIVSASQCESYKRNLATSLGYDVQAFCGCSGNGGISSSSSGSSGTDSDAEEDGTALDDNQEEYPEESTRPQSDSSSGITGTRQEFECNNPCPEGTTYLEDTADESIVPDWDAPCSDWTTRLPFVKNETLCKNLQTNIVGPFCCDFDEGIVAARQSEESSAWRTAWIPSVSTVAFALLGSWVMSPVL